MSQRSARRRPFKRKAGSPRVRRVTFAPFARRIYVRPVRSAFGLQVLLPPHPPRGRLLCGSCSSGQSFAFSFLPASPREATVAVRLGVPGTQGPQRTPTSKSLPARLSPHGSFARLTAGRAMPGAQAERPHGADGRGAFRRFRRTPVSGASPPSCRDQSARPSRTSWGPGRTSQALKPRRAPRRFSTARSPRAV
jgi:hypothetical protein